MTDTQLQTTQAQDILPISPDDNFLAIAEKRMESMNKIKRIAFGATNSHDWVNQEGKPYLQASGAEKVARLFGITIKDVKTRKDVSSDDKGEFFFYVVEAVAMARGGDSIVALGTCSSRDSFFAKRGKEWRLASEVDETNIVKAAYSNCLANAVTRFLGIRNMTWEEVEQFAKFKRDEVAGVQYKKNQAQESGSSPQSPDGKIIVEGLVKDAFPKKFTKKDKTEGTRYVIKVGDKEASSFSASTFKAAVDFQDSGKTVQMVCIANQFGLHIESLTEKQSKVEQEQPATL